MVQHLFKLIHQRQLFFRATIFVGPDNATVNSSMVQRFVLAITIGSSAAWSHRSPTLSGGDLYGNPSQHVTCLSILVL
jgi:hypothetical protein